MRQPNDIFSFNDIAVVVVMLCANVQQKVKT